MSRLAAALNEQSVSAKHSLDAQHGENKSDGQENGNLSTRKLSVSSRSYNPTFLNTARSPGIDFERPSLRRA